MPSAAPVFGCLSLLVSRHLTPSLASVVRVSGCFSSLVSLHLSPALSSGIRLVFGCLFFAFTSLSSGVSFHVSPNLLVSQLICLQSRVCLCGVWLYRLVICLSPSVSFICLGPYALVAVSCSSFMMISFVLRVCLCSLLPCVFLLPQEKIMFHHIFLCVLPLVSHLSPTLSPVHCLRYKWRGNKSKPCGIRKCCL